jgi:hypothetical protein
MSKGKPSIVPKVLDIDIMSSTISLFVWVSGSDIAAGLTSPLSAIVVVNAWSIVAPVPGSRCIMRSQWSRHMSATSQSSSSRTRRKTERRVSTFERHNRATSLSVVSNAHRTSNVAVEVRWNALSVKKIRKKEKGMTRENCSTYRVARTLWNYPFARTS